MLEQLRRNSRSFIIWVLFGIIIAVFIINFGPQANQTVTCGGASTTYVMDVDGAEVDEHAWRFGMNTWQSRSTEQQRREGVLELILVREILAQAAEKAGFRVDTDMANDHIKNGDIFVLGQRANGRDIYFRDKVLCRKKQAFADESSALGDILDEPGLGINDVVGEEHTAQKWCFVMSLFDYNLLERVVTSWGLPSVKYFIQQQRRELLAQQMRMLIVSSARVSLDEARATFIHARTTATADYVRFRPGEYAKHVVLTGDQVAAYLAEHEGLVRETWEAEKSLFEGRDAEIRIRQLSVEKPKSSETQDNESDSGSEDGADEAAASATRAAAVADARAKVTRARARIAAGEDFALVAADVSEDTYAKSGGDRGWRPVNAPGLGDDDLSAAVKELEPGAISEVIETDDGFYVLAVEAKRDGELGYDDVKLEIAERLAREHYGELHARRAAETALAKARASGKNLEELYERETTPTRPPFPGGGPGGIEGFEDLPPELQQQLLEQLSGQSGVLGILEGPIVDASWTQEAQDPPAPAKPAAKPADKPAKPADKPAKPADKPAKPADKPAKPAAEPAKPAAGASDEALPRLHDGIPAPRVARATGFTRRTDEVPGIGTSKELVDAIWRELSLGDIAGQVFEVDGDYLIVQLVDREQANLADFEEEATERLRRESVSKGIDELEAWISRRCRELRDSRKIAVNRSYLEVQDDQGRTLPVTYQPCQSML